ncbi:hypothetical protein KSP39_PZI002372 [Platanthera zijinensis]|uniref:SOSEKI DIX-like domain-containing protein n=1 Tax=Platanthera zijinensis TaxID=2320716 RepID=A0AAP0GDX6_9ASPA
MTAAALLFLRFCRCLIKENHDCCCQETPPMVLPQRCVTVLRGNQIQAMHSWSWKRFYRKSFVWQDLVKDDLILLAHGNDYILKGSLIQSLAAIISCRSGWRSRSLVDSGTFLIFRKQQWPFHFLGEKPENFFWGGGQQFNQIDLVRSCLNLTRSCSLNHIKSFCR